MQNVVCWGYLVALAPQVAFPMLLSIHSGMEQPLREAGRRIVALMGDNVSRSMPVRGISAAGRQLPYWHGVMGERLRFGKLPGMDEAQAKEAAAATSSSLGEGWVFSLPPTVPTSPPSPSSARFSTC